MLSPFGLPVPFILGCRFIRLFRLQAAIITVQLPVAADRFRLLRYTFELRGRKPAVRWSPSRSCLISWFRSLP